MSIPVLICPCISRFDLLERMLRSIDYPIDKIVIVDNSCNDYRVPEDLAHLPIHYIRPIINIGYGGGLNAGISQTPDAPWWIVMNADVFFGPGALAAIEVSMRGFDGPRFVASTSVNPLALGAMNKVLVERVGLFDEWTFFPAYYEDNDFVRRMVLQGIGREFIPIEVYHGESAGPEHGSLTIRSSEQYSVANSRTFNENQRRYAEKWGGLPESETYDTPWNKDVPLDYVKLDLTGRARRSWS